MSAQAAVVQVTSPVTGVTYQIGFYVIGELDGEPAEVTSIARISDEQAAEEIAV